MIEALIAVGVIAFIGLGYASLQAHVVNQGKFIERKFDSRNHETLVRALLSNSANCACNARGVTWAQLSSGDGAQLASLKSFDSAACNTTTASDVTSVGESIGRNTGFTVRDIRMKNPIVTPVVREYIGELEITYDTPPETTPIKPTVIQGLTIRLNAANEVSTCAVTQGGGFADAKVCEVGAVCLKDKKFYFQNKGGQALAVSVNYATEDEFGAVFMTPAGRMTNMNFRLVGNNLVPSAPSSNWRPMVCFSHMPAIGNCDPAMAGHTNCGSGIYWVGSSAGSSASLSGFYECP